MKVSRRNMLAGMVAAPAAGSLASWKWRHGHGSVFLYDADLPEARKQADASIAWQQRVLPIEGDRIRFARVVVEAKPASIRGVSRQADAVLIEEVAAEAGYERVALEVDGDVLTWTLMPRIRARG